MEEHSLNPVSSSFCARFKLLNWEDSFNRKIFYSRLAVLSLLGLISLGNTFTGYLLPARSSDCIWDGMFVYTEGINTYLSENLHIKNLIIILSSLLIDILLIDFAIRWLVYGTSWRPILFLTLFYASRAIVQHLFVLQFPYEYLWSYPGFPSLNVSYKKTSDFFFSGHAGILTFCALENYSSNRFKTAALASVGTGYVAFVMIVTRGHYSIDILTGVIFAHYFWIISGWMTEDIDKNYSRRKSKYLEI